MRTSPDTGRQTESPTLSPALSPALAAAGVTAALCSSVCDSIRTAGRARPPGALGWGRLLAGSPVPGSLGPVRREAWPTRAAWPGMDADSAREEAA
ncbi:hypothetical protein ABZ260_31535 [Streptosporangium sp. NPDC006013]|uniref:hypothetical protein n=1 Tax=Streptosporangium sp. NPDC006013 TaxID=3155596 RepID=UPI0033BAD7AF